MTILSHILFTTSGVKIMELNGKELLLAYVFGVLIDLDHLVKLPLYLKKNNFKISNIFKQSLPRERYYNWRTSLQEPIALSWIIPIAIFLNSIIPIIFFLSHLFLDYLMNYRKSPFYPLSKFAIRGLSTSISNKTKEFIIIIISICLILLHL